MESNSVPPTDRVVEVRFEQSFGCWRIYPCNELAKTITRDLLSRRTLNSAQLVTLRKLGYRIHEVPLRPEHFEGCQCPRCEARDDGCPEEGGRAR